MDRKKIVEVSTYILLIVILLAPRIAALDSFSTLDEPYWLSMGANFYYALGQREFDKTIYEYQPAVTTMWIITAAMLIYFPEYRALDQGYLSMEKALLDPFLLEHGKDPLMLLYLARLIQILVITCLFLLSYYFLQYFVPKSIALFALIFASFDPFFLGQSRLLDHEAMLSLFVLVSLLAFGVFLWHRRNPVFLILSGAAAGFAQLTKSSAIAMLLPVGVLLLIRLVEERHQGFFKSLLNQFKTLAIWLGILGATYFIFWPGMWVAPAKMLYEVYGNAFSYAFQGARLKVTGELVPSEFRLDSNLLGLWETTGVLLWRTTPLTWMGVLAGLIVLVMPRREWDRSIKQLSALLLVTAISFILMIGIAQGRNSPHYILASYLALNLFAGLGWFYIVKWFMDRRNGFRYAALSVLILAQLWSAASFYPYYYTYRNPLLYRLGGYRDFPQFPYGEGLELAAQSLAGQPDAENSVSLVYYSRGCFSYFYPGTTVGFRPFWVDGEHAEDLLNAIHSADYIVVYYALQGHLEKYAGLLDALSIVKPMHEVWLDGYKYVVVYKVDDMPATVFDTLSK